jgi:hypothetical protein
VHRHARVAGPVDRRIVGAGRHEHRIHPRARGQRLLEKARALEHEGTLVASEPATRDQAPEPLHLRVAEAEHAQLA